jgi:SAM domain (Sterile alpha motif)
MEWLEGFGLGQYGEAFMQAAVDASVLPDLTEADLEKLGVVLGHRKRLLRAIAALAAPESEQPPGSSAALTPAPAKAERRQLTCCFAT